MKSFTLNQLLQDALINGPIQVKSTKSLTTKQIDLIHFLVENLIGSDHYDLMNRNLNAEIVFKPITVNVKHGQYLRMYHGLTN